PRLAAEPGRVIGRDNAADRIGIDDARVGNHVPDGVDAGDRRADQVDLELPAAAGGVRREEGSIAPRPREVGDFVDRCDVKGGAGAAVQIARDGGAVLGEAPDEVAAEGIELFGVTVVEEIPDLRDPELGAGLYERRDAAEVVAPAAIHQ